MTNKKEYHFFIEYRIVFPASYSGNIQAASHKDFKVSKEEYEAIKEFIKAKMDELDKGLKKYEEDKNWDEIPL